MSCCGAPGCSPAPVKLTCVLLLPWGIVLGVTVEREHCPHRAATLRNNIAIRFRKATPPAVANIAYACFAYVGQDGILQAD